MSEKLTFKTGVCRECKFEWDLDRTYSKQEITDAVSELAHCPKCKGIRCSFPYATGVAPSTPVPVENRGTPEFVKRKPKRKRKDKTDDDNKESPGGQED